MKKEPVNLRVDVDLKAKLDEAAIADHRTLTGMIMKILHEWLEAREKKVSQ